MSKNIYIFFNQGSWRTVHTLATKLQKLDIINNIAAMTDHKRVHDSLQEQSKVKYNQLHCVPSVHNSIDKNAISDPELSNIEDKFGNPSLRDFVIAQRGYAKFPEDKKKRLIGGWFQFYSELFNNFNTDIFFTPSVAAAHSWIPYWITHQTGGTAISLKSTRVNKRHALMINNAKDHFPEILSSFHDFVSGDDSIQEYPDCKQRASEYISTFRCESADKIPGYFSISQKSPELSDLSAFPMKAVSAISYWLKYHTNLIQPNYVRGDYRRNSLSDKVINETRSFARRLYLKHVDFFDPVNYDNKFVFFPLHLQPEASTLILAPMFLNQIALVQQVARSLPINYKLYVKPNPNMFGWRDIRYYNKLKDISGVRLIHPLNDSHELIRQSELVTTITGTAGLEAALYRKPVVTFGSVNYNMMDMIYNCNDVQSLSRILFDGINEYTHNEQELHQYMTAVFQNSISLNNSLFDVSEDAVENDAEKILSMIVEHI